MANAETRGWSEKTNTARNAKAGLRGCAARRRREARIYQPRARRESHQGTETPVNSGNKKMIKSDLMSRRRRRQAKTHICHSESDAAAAPPSRFPLPNTPPGAHSFITLPPSSDVSSHRAQLHKPSMNAPRAFKQPAHTHILQLLQAKQSVGPHECSFSLSRLQGNKTGRKLFTASSTETKAHCF